MKILINYFSGTGNTKRAVDNYVNFYRLQNIEVDIYNIEDNDFKYNLNDYDLIGIAHPIYAFNAPSIINKFVKSLSKCETLKRVFIIKTSGEPIKLNNSSSNVIKRVLKKKNMVVTNEYHYVMPYNIIFRHTDYEAFKMLITMEKLIPIDAQEILDNKKNILKPIFFARFVSSVLRIEFLADSLIGKTYHINKKCLHCMKCVNNCPMHNISYNKEKDKFHFSNKCIICQRCSFTCPNDAIRTGILNLWRVNKPYSFAKTDEETIKTHHKNYCKKAYKRYYKLANEKINLNTTI